MRQRDGEFRLCSRCLSDVVLLLWEWLLPLEIIREKGRSNWAEWQSWRDMAERGADETWPNLSQNDVVEHGQMRSWRDEKRGRMSSWWDVLEDVEDACRKTNVRHFEPKYKFSCFMVLTPCVFAKRWRYVLQQTCNYILFASIILLIINFSYMVAYSWAALAEILRTNNVLLHSRLCSVWIRRIESYWGYARQINF